MSIFLTTKFLHQPQSKGVQGRGKSLRLTLVSDSTIHFPRVLSEAVKEQRIFIVKCKPDKYYATPPEQAWADFLWDKAVSPSFVAH